MVTTLFHFSTNWWIFKRLWDDAERAMNEEDNKKKE